MGKIFSCVVMLRWQCHHGTLRSLQGNMDENKLANESGNIGELWTENENSWALVTPLPLN